jgi:hypothetical protein
MRILQMRHVLLMGSDKSHASMEGTDPLMLQSPESAASATRHISVELEYTASARTKPAYVLLVLCDLPICLTSLILLVDVRQYRLHRQPVLVHSCVRSGPYQTGKNAACQATEGMMAQSQRDYYGRVIVPQIVAAAFTLGSIHNPTRST